MRSFSHSVIAARYLTLFSSRRWTTHARRSQRKPRYGTSVPKGTDFDGSHRIPRREDILHQQFINLPGRSCSYWCQASRLPESAWLQNDPERIICHLMQSSCIQASVLYTVFEMDPGILSVRCPAEPRRAHRCHSSHSSRPSQSPLSDTEFHTVCATASPSSRPILVAATVTFIAVVYTQIE